MNFSLRQAFNAGVAALDSAFAISAAHAHHTEVMVIDIGLAVANAVVAGVSLKDKTPSP